MRAASGHQGGLLCQSLRQLVWLPGATKLAIAECRCASGSAFLQDRGLGWQASRAPPPGMNIVLAQDDAT